MTKFIPVAFAIVALGASLSPALAGGRNGADNNLIPASVATYTAPGQKAPVTASRTVAPTVQYTGAEAAIISQNSHEH